MPVRAVPEPEAKVGRPPSHDDLAGMNKPYEGEIRVELRDAKGATPTGFRSPAEGR